MAATVSIYNLDSNIKGVNGFGRKFCNTIFSCTLGASSDTSLSVPTAYAMGMPNAPSNNKFVAIINVQTAKEVFIALNQSAAAPAGNSFMATTSELLPPGIPVAYLVQAGDAIHFFATAQADVTVAFYAILEN